MTNKRQREMDDSSGLKPAKKPKLAKVFDGTYFDNVEHDENQKSVAAKCTNCLPKTKIIRGSTCSTGNFFKHYLKMHPDKHDEMKIYCDERFQKVAAETKTKIQSFLPFSNVFDPKKVSKFIFPKTVYCKINSAC